MPELPEVSIIVSQLRHKLKGLVIENVEYDWPKKFDWGQFSVADIKGARVLNVRRWGKVLIIDLLSSKRGPKQPYTHIAILIHLKLTGQLIYQDQQTRVAGGHPIPPLNRPVPNSTTRVTFAFNNGAHLYFNDMRKFGWVKIVEGLESKIKEAIGIEMGPDPLEISYEEFKDRLRQRGKARLKKLLMDQTFIAGVGNIYSDEALWRAKIHPKRLAGSLNEAEIKGLYEGIKESLKVAIERGGSSTNAFVDSRGERGLYLSYAQAYHMTGKPCSRCRTPIVRQKIDGRSAHFCPTCQRL